RSVDVLVDAVHHVIHFTRNKRYVQRAESSDIQHMFFDQRQQTVALVGMGGVGKTQLALDFAYWVKENKPAYSVFWVPAFSFAGFEQAYTDIAKELGLRPNTEGEDVKTTVRQFLNSKAAGCWLLIIDNADDMDIFYGSAGEQEQDGLINHIPTSDNGIILFTTRSREVALAVADDAPIDLLAMEKDEAETLLGKSIHRKQLLQDHDTVAKLLDFLTYLPLAITQASAYLNRNTSLSITRYLELLQGTEDTLIRTMSREFRDSTRYSNSSNAIATTWLVSFEQIRQIDSHAADLLYFVSRIEPKSIPRSILPCSGSKKELEYAIGTLTSYSFIFERDETQTFDMHSLVHLATRVWVAKESIDQQIKADATKHLNKIFPTDHYTNRALWRQYMPHALKNLKESTEPEIEEMLDLSSQVGRCLLEDARTQEAIKLLEHVVEVREETLDEGHPDRLASQHVLARAYQADGRVKEAIELLEHVVEVQEKTLDEGHPHRLASQHTLAYAYEADGRAKEATEVLVSPSGETNVAGLVSMASLIADHGAPVSSSIYKLLIWWDKRMGANDVASKRTTSKSPTSKRSSSDSEQIEEIKGVIFSNRFASLRFADDAPSEPQQEAESESEVSDTETTQKKKMDNNKKKGKGKKAKKTGKAQKTEVKARAKANIHTNEMSPKSYRILENDGDLMTNYTMAILTITAELSQMRLYLMNLWHEVATEGLSIVVAGAVSHVAIAKVKKTEQEVFVDFPGYECFESITGTLTRGNRDRFQQLTEAKAAAKPFKDCPNCEVDVREKLLLYAYQDLVDFVTDFQQSRNGRPTKAMRARLVKWDPTFRLEDATKAERIKWRRAYTINYLYELVNEYSALEQKQRGSNRCFSESVDWSPKDPTDSERWLLGMTEFAAFVTSLVTQKSGVDFQRMILPRHVFQLQCIVDATMVAQFG
ncbi:phosphorylase superfamily protein, partial [Colletotrichum musicola]